MQRIIAFLRSIGLLLSGFHGHAGLYLYSIKIVSRHLKGTLGLPPYKQQYQRQSPLIGLILLLLHRKDELGQQQTQQFDVLLRHSQLTMMYKLDGLLFLRCPRFFVFTLAIVYTSPVESSWLCNPLLAQH